MARLHLHVFPGARQERLDAHAGGELRVHVTARATEGAANRAVLALLSKKLRIPKSAFTIVRGETSRQKVVEVDGWDDEALRSRLRERVAGDGGVPGGDGEAGGDQRTGSRTAD